MVACFAHAELPVDSPFLPEDGVGGGRGKAVSLELRGIVEAPGSVKFSIFDLEKHKGFWTELHELHNGLVVVRYDPVESAAVVRRNGETSVLRLRASKIIAETS